MPRNAKWMGRRWLAIALVIVAIIVASVMLYISFADDVERAAVSGLFPGGGYGARLPYYGPSSLEERILGSVVVARVRLNSTTQVVEELAYSNGETIYAKTLAFNFEVLEYLRGSGGSALTALAPDLDAARQTRQGAAGGEDLLAGRDTRWDGRDAIVFLTVDHLSLPSIAQADRYWLGPLRLVGEEYYSIASGRDKRWLPAAASGASGASGEQHFLLDAPSGAGASGEAGSAATITLAQMKTKIADIEQKVTGGGGSEAYRDCLYHKYQWEREVRYRKEGLGGIYHRIRHDEALASGLPAETQVYTSIDTGPALQAYGPTPPASNWGEFRVVGKDEDVFHPRWPGVAVTTRPLPAGMYQFHWAYRPPQYVICDAHPEDELKRHEVFVTVTAPSGTAHEAFFDPVAIGTGFGADGTNGALKPKAFTVGGSSASLRSLTWQGGSVVLTLAPYAALTGQTLDVLAIDGALSLSLAASAATVDATAGTLTWSVASQPWKAGDLLMLRLRSGAASPTATPTA